MKIIFYLLSFFNYNSIQFINNPYVSNERPIIETQIERDAITSQYTAYYKTVTHAFSQYPLNHGAEIGTRKIVTLQIGKILFRYGSIFGYFFTDQCIEESKVALPYIEHIREVHCFKVIKPFEIEFGIVKPWFGQPGGANQYDSEDQKEETRGACSLLRNGYIKYKKKCKCTGNLDYLNERIDKTYQKSKNKENAICNYNGITEYTIESLINISFKCKSETKN